MIAEVTICPDPRCNLSKKIARCSPAALWAMQTQPSLFSLQLSAVQCVQALSDKIIGQVSPDVIRAWVDGDQVLQHSALPSTPAPSLPPRADGSRRRGHLPQVIVTILDHGEDESAARILAQCLLVQAYDRDSPLRRAGIGRPIGRSPAAGRPAPAPAAPSARADPAGARAVAGAAEIGSVYKQLAEAKACLAEYAALGELMRKEQAALAAALRSHERHAAAHARRSSTGTPWSAEASPAARFPSAHPQVLHEKLRLLREVTARQVRERTRLAAQLEQHEQPLLGQGGSPPAAALAGAAKPETHFSARGAASANGGARGDGAGAGAGEAAGRGADLFGIRLPFRTEWKAFAPGGGGGAVAAAPSPPQDGAPGAGAGAGAARRRAEESEADADLRAAASFADWAQRWQVTDKDGLLVRNGRAAPAGAGGAGAGADAESVGAGVGALLAAGAVGSRVARALGALSPEVETRPRGTPA